MKPRVPLIATALALATSIGICAYATDMQGSAWTEVGDGYYTNVAGTKENIVLQRELTDKEYQEIQEQLIDTNRASDLVAAERIKTDPDATLPDNMLPDGRFLKDNWETLEQELVKQYQTTLVSTEKGVYRQASKQNTKTMSVVLDAEEGLSLQMERVDSGEATTLVPKAVQDSGLTATMMPDGQKVIAASKDSMWIISDDGNTVDLAVPNVYQGKSYDTMVQESYDSYGEDAVLWCGQETASPNSTKVAFVANKNDIGKGYSLFIYDTETGSEKLVRPANGAFYLIVNWVDEDHVLCYKLQNDTDRTFVVIGTDGSEVELQFAIPDVQMISAKSGLIAYTNPENNKVYVGKFKGTSALTPVFEESVGGVLRLRDGVNEFNSDASKLALVYVPDDNADTRNVKVFDLTRNAENSSEKILLPQSAIRAKKSVLEVSWMANDDLMVIEETQNAKQSEYSTWQYAEMEAAK